MPNYETGLIYIIKCKDETKSDTYIGSTCNLKNRQYAHNSGCNNPTNRNYNRDLYKKIRLNGGMNNHIYIILEKKSCKNKKELLALERLYIEKIKPSLNKEIPGRSKNERKEYMKQYLKEYNKKKLLELKKYRNDYYKKNIIKIKAYAEDNKDAINARRRKTYKNKI